MKQNFKYIGVIILVIILIVILLFAFRKKIIAHFVPTIKQVGIINVKFENDTTYISSKLIVSNKSFIKVNIDSIKYKISLFDKVYIENRKYLGVKLGSYAQDSIDVSVNVPYVTILKDIKAERKKGDSANYVINVSLQYSTIFGKIEIPINKTADIKIPQPPELEILDIKYAKIRFKSILADVRLKITNHNDMALSITSINYAMNISTQGNMSGNHKQVIKIKPAETTIINFPIEINPKNLGKTIFDIIVDRDNYAYTLKISAIIESPIPMQKSFEIRIVKTGIMELKK